ncbi:MAG: AMP-binding protein [Corynebacterium sp.]|nr:AMP-binding protein [Corynebacterium sp.]
MNKLTFTRFTRTLAQLKDLVPELIRSGVISTEGGIKAVLATPVVLARYRFTTAREVEQGAIACPDRVALIDDSGSLTYSELRENSRILASYLRDKMNGNIHMGVMARNGRGIIYPMAAKGFAGATVYLQNIGSSKEQLTSCIKRDGVNVLVIDEEFIDRFDAEALDIPVIIAHRDSDRDLGSPSLDNIIATYKPGRRLPVLPKHGPIVVMSSGTTGTPKGVIRVEPVAPTVLAGILTKVPWQAGMRVQITASMFHAWGWSVFNIALGMRGTIVTHRIFDPERVFQDIHEHKLDAMISSPIFMKDLVNLPGNEQYDCSSLKFIFSSGNALSPWLVEKMHERFGKNLCNLYGSTEISAVAVASMEDVARHPTTSGPICTGTDFIILDENDRPCPTGTPGRIFCYNTVTLAGYTDPKIPMNQYKHLVQIGDRGYLDENGFLFVLGRADDMIIVGGENVYPRSVEEVLEGMPGIADMYAGGVEDPDTFKRIAVWVVRSDDAAGVALTTEAVQDWVLDRLAAHSVPRDVHFVESLPRTATGKVIPHELVPPQV